MARTYKRDSRGRFAGGGGGSSGGRGGRPATKRVQRGTNRLTRDNSGKITGQGGSGATARGGRLKTAAGNQRATQLDRLKGRITGTVGKGGKVKGGGRPSGIGAIPKGDLKRYRMLQNKINPLRNSLDRDGSTMVGSTNRKLADQASARYSQNLNKLNRITSTMRRLSNSPGSANIPRLPRVASVGKRLGRTAAIKKMDGPRKFGGQSWRDLRGQYSGGRVQYEDNYMNKWSNRKNKGTTIRSSRPTGTIRAASARPKQARALAAPTGSRTRSQAKAVQSFRRNAILDRTRRWSGRNPGIRRGDTGMRQLSMTGPSKTLYSFKRTNLGRR